MPDTFGSKGTTYFWDSKRHTFVSVVPSQSNNVPKYTASWRTRCVPSYSNSRNPRFYVQSSQRPSARGRSPTAPWALTLCRRKTKTYYSGTSLCCNRHPIWHNEKVPHLARCGTVLSMRTNSFLYFSSRTTSNCRAPQSVATIRLRKNPQGRGRLCRPRWCAWGETAL